MINRFDYIVVGAGSAGCVLTNRLSADPETSREIIDAGLPAIMPSEPLRWARTTTMWSTLSCACAECLV